MSLSPARVRRQNPARTVGPARCRPVSAFVMTTALAAAVAGCGTAPETAGSISVENCGERVSLDGPPERVTILDSAAIPTLHRLGVLDRIGARAGLFPPEYYDAELNAALGEVPSLTDRVDATGHLQISREAVVATAPDLVIGQTDTVNRQTLASSDIPLIDEPAFCGSLEHDASFEDVWSQIRTYGEVFGHADQAEEYIGELSERLTRMTADVPSHHDRPTVAVLYPTLGGGTTYAYGRRSMSNPLVEAAGLDNVFGDTADRVFEVTGEELISRDPDYVIALHSDGSPADVRTAVAQIPGIEAVSALRDGAVLPLLLGFAEPPTPLAVDGLAAVRDFVAAREGSETLP